MNNTGLLLSRPGESYYGAYYRFILANRSLSLKLVEINKNPKIKNEYRLAKFANLIEHRFCKFYGIDRFDLPQEVKTNYRPEKCCPDCFKAGYHSYVFDYHWLKYCPVHNTELVAICPGCNRPWPAYSELKLVNNCSLCGSSKGFPDLTQNHGKFVDEYKRIELIQDILEIRSKNFVADAIMGIPMLKKHYSSGLTALNNILVFSLLKKEKLISSQECKELSMVREICFENIETVIFTVNDEVSLSSLSTWRNKTLIEKEQSIFDRVEAYILKSFDLTKINHDVCSCINDRGMCSSCLPLILFLLFGLHTSTAYPKGDLYLWDARERIRKYEHWFRGTLDAWCEFITELGYCNFFKTDNGVWSCRLNYISEKFLEAELLLLTYIIFNQISELPKSISISWKDFSTHTKMLLHKIKNMDIPVVLVIKDDELVLTYENNSMININNDSYD